MKQFHFGVVTLSLHLPPFTMTKWTNRTLDINFIRKGEDKGNLLLQTFHETERSRESDVSSSRHHLRDEGDEFVKLTSRLKIYPA